MMARRDENNRVQSGKYLQMHYTGTIDETSSAGTPGKQFDSSRDRGSTFDFKIGQGQVIQGWEEGLVGLCVGAKAILVIPPDMGYGELGAGDDIPGDSTLRFDIEVVGVSDEGTPEPNLFAELDKDSDGKLTKDEVLAYFKKEGQDEIPEGLWNDEDKDGDGVITWEEFSGPKGGGKAEL
eukprot:TRINITY_DN3063_c0_g1_i1.p1 TRINITY_DN3063_c0_g1~~TRINITY_DN3063_c0_g1_i1.p1  ORF type:complete len:180 (-),score=46.59 TRINITY_DN3063_c0_g1_i1:179-718(-)